MPFFKFNKRTKVDGPELNAALNELVTLSEDDTKLILVGRDEGNGKLFVTTLRLIWLSKEDASKGYAIDYPFITLHAISRDTTAFSEPCIYCQLQDFPEDEAAESNEDVKKSSNDKKVADDVDEKDEDEEDIPEMMLVPADAEKLEAIFNNIADMAALNPDALIEEDAYGYDGDDQLNDLADPFAMEDD